MSLMRSNPGFRGQMVAEGGVAVSTKKCAEHWEMTSIALGLCIDPLALPYILSECMMLEISVQVVTCFVNII